jgi:hypothetical protein
VWAEAERARLRGIVDSSGSLAMLAAMRRASSRLNSLAATHHLQVASDSSPASARTSVRKASMR